MRPTHHLSQLRRSTPQARAVLIAGSLLVTALSSTSCSSGEGDEACPSATATTQGRANYRPEDLDGVNVEDCDLVGQEVSVGGFAIRIPGPGEAVTSYGDPDEAGEPAICTASTAPDGMVTITISG